MTLKEDDSITASAQMCNLCFDTLLKKLLRPSSSSDANSKSDDTIISTNSSRYTPPNVTCPLFVTWEKCRSLPPRRRAPPLLSKEVSSSSGIATPATTSSSIITDDETSTHNTTSATTIINSNTNDDSIPPTAPIYELRGCIGTLAPRQLQHALSEFAITSALHDHRFDPISLHELPLLRVGVSLLVKYEECQNCLDWVVGVHGIIIKFGGTMEQQQHYSATFLPEVAKEQSWTTKETVVALIRKAGYRGTVTNDLLSKIQCTRYQSSKCRVSYSEYVDVSHDGKDPLGDSVDDWMAAAVKEEVGRRNRVMNHVKPCVNL
ncbi:hypothetical protein ACHAWT_003236 [Skeletonema menzelii]